MFRCALEGIKDGCTSSGRSREANNAGVRKRIRVQESVPSLVQQPAQAEPASIRRPALPPLNLSSIWPAVVSLLSDSRTILWSPTVKVTAKVAAILIAAALPLIWRDSFLAVPTTAWHSVSNFTHDPMNNSANQDAAGVAFQANSGGPALKLHAAPATSATDGAQPNPGAASQPKRSAMPPAITTAPDKTSGSSRTATAVKASEVESDTDNTRSRGHFRRALGKVARFPLWRKHAAPSSGNTSNTSSQP